MKRKQLKFVVGPVAVIMTLAFIAFSAFDDNKAYFQTIPELYQMAEEGTLEGKRLKVVGEVLPGSIHRGDDFTDFVIGFENQTMAIHYVGKDPLPDTFRDYAEAVVDGQYSGDGLFTGTKLQAKCSSKYERELEAGVVPGVTALAPPNGS